MNKKDVKQQNSTITTVEWQFENVSGYSKMISGCIEELTVKWIGSIPFTAGRKGNKEMVNFLDIHIVFQSDWIKLRARYDDFYIIGFRNKFGFFEFFPQSKEISDRLVSESTWLPFVHTYKAITNSWGHNETEIPIGYYSISAAIIGLGRYNNNVEKKQVAEWLLTMLIVVPESARFKRVYNKVSSFVSSKTTYEKTRVGVLGDLKNLLTTWGYHSKNIKLSEDEELKKIDFPEVRDQLKKNALLAKEELFLGVDTEIGAKERNLNIVPCSLCNLSIADCDMEVSELTKQEMRLQDKTIQLVASENFISKAALEALGCPLVNKYAEGAPNKRYSGGNVLIDELENLCKSRALNLFGLDSTKWGVNVQPYSPQYANFALYLTLLQSNKLIMGLDMLSGGNVSHGYYTFSEKVSAASKHFLSLPYSTIQETGLVDYTALQENAMSMKPELIICGGAAYPRDWDYAKFRSVANGCDALLLCDMGHLSGLVAAQEAASPFDHCHVVTASTDKILRGPPSCVIFYQKGLKHPRDVKRVCNYENIINSFVSPSLQGGPHVNLIAAMGATFKLAMEPCFRAYAKQVKMNALVLAQHLQSKGHQLVTNGTDSDIFVWDLRPHELTGDEVVHICGLCNVSLKRCPLLGDHNPMALSGILIGTAAMTSRGLVEGDFEQIGEFLHEAVKTCIKLKKGTRYLKTVLAENMDVIKLGCRVLNLLR